MKKNIANYVIGVLVFATLGLQKCAGEDGENRQEAIAVLQASLASIESLSTVVCHYNAVQHYVKTEDDAIAGKVTSKRKSAKVVWAMDGEYESVRLKDDPETTEALKKEHSLTPIKGHPNLLMSNPVPWYTADSIKGPVGSFSYQADHASGSVRKPISQWMPAYPPIYGPSSVAYLYYVKVFLNELEHNPDLYNVKVDMRDSANEVVILIQETGNVVNTHELVLSSNHGYAPLRIVDKPVDKSIPFRKIYYMNYEQVKQGVLFPMRCIQIRNRPLVGDYLATDLQVTELNTTAKPPRSHFEIEVEPGSWILHAEDNASNGFQTRKRERIHADDLGRIYEMTQRAVKEPYMDTAIVQPRRYTWAWWLGGGVGVVALLLLVRYVLRRRMA